MSTQPYRFVTVSRLAALCAVTVSSACAGVSSLSPRAYSSDELAWLAPTAPGDLRALDRWRRGVGPAYVTRTDAAPAAAPRLLVVTWNTAVGAADVVAFVSSLRAREGRDVPIVLLLQEVYRAGASVPRDLDRRASVAARIGLTRDASQVRDVESIARALGMNACYAPSMRNGAPKVSDEDRGNAILSTLPLSELTAIELPFERQRRVAVVAHVSGLAADGQPWSLRVVSAHLDTFGGARRLWMVGGGYARLRQARALLAFMADSTPTILGGDLNTVWGFDDRAYKETARVFQAPLPRDRRPTFRGLLRLDHVFFRLPEGWRAEYERGPSRFGSDHHPLIAQVDLGSGHQ
ncbi:MAG: endonuclease/exonuclease/phosphatase family protein [Vicinamibacterales bacterium]